METFETAVVPLQTTVTVEASDSMPASTPLGGTCALSVLSEEAARMFGVSEKGTRLPRLGESMTLRRDLLQAGSMQAKRGR